MNDAIRISVVLASCNGAAFIGEQLRSLLDSLDQSDEIVVADDASTDDTAAVAARLGDPRIRVLRFEQRVGYQKNFERAIAAARGRFIFFSDQDDRCLPERVAMSLDALAQHACVCGDAIVADAQLNPTASSFFEMRGARSFSALGMLLRPAAIGATMACRRSFLDTALPFPDEVPHDHWMSVLAASRRQLAVVRRPFILYRRHVGVASPTGLARPRRRLRVIARERWRLVLALWQRRKQSPAA